MNLRVFYLYKTVGFGWLHSNEAAIRRKEGTIKRERVISLP